MKKRLEMLNEFYGEFDEESRLVKNRQGQLEFLTTLHYIKKFIKEKSKIDNSFDMTLVLGPLYHLYEEEEQHKALDEAIRVTKKDGIIIAAFLSAYAIMNSNYLQGNFREWYYVKKKYKLNSDRLYYYIFYS